MSIEMWIFQFPSAGIPHYGQNWPSLVFILVSLLPLPSRTTASGSRLPSRSAEESIELLQRTTRKQRRSCSRKLLWRKNTASVSLFQRAPIETGASEPESFSFQAFFQPWPFYRLFACFCIASFMRTMKSLQIKQKFHVIQCVWSLSVSQTKKVLIEFLNHRLREAG